MNPGTFSVAMPAVVDLELRQHLIRDDQQEDVCIATYSPSNGSRRMTACVRSVIFPQPGERRVHGNASFTGAWIARAAKIAAHRGLGIVLLHSHPAAREWQLMSQTDRHTESGYAGLVTKVTGLPMIGMTVAGGSAQWSSRAWAGRDAYAEAESVRVVGDNLVQSFNPATRPAPSANERQIRTVSAWGEVTQSAFARTRVLVVGLGSVGLDVAVRLAASGVCTVGVMDFDEVEAKNLDRMIGGTRRDARMRRAKIDVAVRLMRAQATATTPDIRRHEVSICTPEGLAIALDYDVIISCVDRPWPRAVLNSVAYADFIPVIDGGIDIENFDDGSMRVATARIHTLMPGLPCMVCSKQIDLARVGLDKEGLLDNEDYVRRAGIRPGRTGQNVSTLSAMVSAEILAQFVSLIAAPSGKGVPVPLRFNFKHHIMEPFKVDQIDHCLWERNPGEGDSRIPLVGPHARAAAMIEARRGRQRTIRHRTADLVDGIVERLSR